jgi:cell wall-associated NlpC family hydrolase
MRVNRPVIDLRETPDGPRISQLLFGESFSVEKQRNSHCFGRAACGYQGWLPEAALETSRAASAYVSAMASYIYAKPDMKSEPRLRLPFGAKVKALGTDGAYTRLPEGYVFTAHLRTAPLPDFVATATGFLGVPYLWGGRSSLGIDCSGLVQTVLQAAGLNVPRDTGPQSETIGKALPDHATLQRGDLIFWKGHVGLMQDATTLLHATAFSMSVITEPLAETVARVKAQGYGDITARRRL